MKKEANMEMIPGKVFPKLAIFTTTLGTVAAMYYVPDAYQEKGQLFIPALLATAGILFAPAVAVLRDLRSVIRVENILALAPVYWLLLDPMQGLQEIDTAQKNDVIKAFAAIGIFGNGIWLGSLGKAWTLPGILRRASRGQLSASVTFNISVCCFTLGVFYFLFKANFNLHTLIQSLQAMRSEAAWSRNSAEGGWGAFGEHLAYFGMLLPSLAVLLGRRAGLLDVRTMIVWVLAFIYALFQAQGGNRRYLGVMFGAAIVVWMLSPKRVTLRDLALCVVFCLGLIFLMEFVYQYRGTGAEMFQDSEQKNELTSVRKVHVDDNFLRLAQSIYYVPSMYPYVWGDYIYFALIRPIPRVLWHSKPISPSFRIQDEVGAQSSLSSSIVGELYVSGGFLMILVGGWLYGRLGTWFNALIRLPTTDKGGALYGAWLMALFAGCRSMMDLVMMSYVVLAMIFIFWLFQAQLASGQLPGSAVKNK